MATAIPQLFNSPDFAVIAELLYRRTGLLVKAEEITYVLTALPGTESATDSFIGYGDGLTVSYVPSIQNVAVAKSLTVSALRQTLDGVTTVLDPSTYSIVSGRSITFTVAPPKLARLHGDFSGVPAPYLTLTAVTTLPDMSKGPFVGSVRLELDGVSIGGQIPAILVYSDAFPPTADELIRYMQLHFDFHMTDNEFFMVSDASHTPIARGGGPIAGTLDANRRFQLEAANGSIRWLPGSRITLQQQSIQSIVPDGLFAFIGNPVNGSLGEPYNYTFQTVNGVAPITYSVISGTPPAPIDPVTGAMHADQLTTLASYSWVMEAMDAAGHLTTKNCIMKVEVTPLVMSPDSTTPLWTVGVAQSLNFNPYGGQRPYHYGVTSGSLPVGLAIVGDGLQGTMEGNPSSSNTSLQQVFTITAFDNQGQAAVMNFNATIQDRSVPDILTSLRAKIVNWWEASLDLYPSGQLQDGDVLYDATGHQNLTVSALTAGATLSLTTTGRANSPQAFVFDASQDATPAVAQALSTAYGLSNDFTYVALVNVPSTALVVAGQTLMGRGGDSNGGSGLSIGPGGNTLSLAVNVSGNTTVNNFTTTLPVGVGNWSFINAMRYQGLPTLILNGGTAENGANYPGAIASNTSQFFTLGSNPAKALASAFIGGLGMASIYQAKLWSDERKWLWNNGALRAFVELGYFAPATAIQLPAGYSSTWTYGTPLNIVLTLTGGSGTYVRASVSAGALPPGVTMDFDGISTITLTGSPTQLGNAAPFTIKAVSTDGGVALQAFNDVTVVNVVAPLVDLAMSGVNGQTTVTDATGRLWTVNGDAVIKTDVDSNGAMYFSGQGNGGYLSTPLTADMNLTNTSFTVSMDFYLMGAGNWYMVGAGDGANMPLLMGAFNQSGGVAYSELAWVEGGVVKSSVTSQPAPGVAKTTWNRMKGIFNAADTTWRLFVNGQYMGTQAWPGVVHGAVNTSDVLVVGANYLSAGVAQSPFAGYLRHFNWSTGITYDTLALNTTSFGAFIPNQSGSFTTAILGGNGTYSVSATGLPVGLTATLTGGNAVAVAGTTSVGYGSYNASVTLTSGDGQSVVVPITVVVSYPTLTLSGTYTATATTGTAYSSDLTIAGGDGTYSNPRITLGALPAGLALSVVGSTLNLSGTPTAAVASTFTVAVDSGDGQTATSSQSVTVAAGTVANASAWIPQTPYFVDTFVGSANSLLLNHVADTGQGYHDGGNDAALGYFGQTNYDTALLTGTGGIYVQAANFETSFMPDAIPTALDMYVEFIVDISAIAAGKSYEIAYITPFVTSGAYNQLWLFFSDTQLDINTVTWNVPTTQDVYVPYTGGQTTMKVRVHFVQHDPANLMMAVFTDDVLRGEYSGFVGDAPSLGRYYSTLEQQLKITKLSMGLLVAP